VKRQAAPTALLIVAVLSALIASSATALILRGGSSEARAASQPAARCQPPYGAHWLCPGSGVYANGVGWSCFNYGTHLYCSLGGSAKTATRASVFMLPKAIRVQVEKGATRTFQLPG
jgi:hypothetical protein